MLAPSRETTEGTEFSAGSYGSDEDYDDEIDAAPPPIAAQTSDTVLETADLVRLQEVEIHRLAELFAVPRTTASTLLRRFGWKSERLIEAFMDNPEKVLADAGLAAPSVARGASASAALVSCDICAEERPPHEFAAPSCGDRFCAACWGEYVKGKLFDDGEATGIRCMRPGCGVMIEPTMVQAVVDAPTYAAYARHADREFVTDNPHLKFCPAAGCTKVVKVGSLGASEVACSCGMLFCFKCSREAHFPLSCAQLAAWEEKGKGDGETAKWIKVNTQKCPKCGWPIEKNGGCNHMTCRRRECGHEFCWLCMGPWRGHTTCGAYKADASLSETKAELERYLFYYERYEVHLNSQRLEDGLRQAARDHMRQIIDAATSDGAGSSSGASNLPLTEADVEYVADATEALIECRRTLKCTYPFAYFMDQASAERPLFEYLQGDLDRTTERLSKELEAAAAGADRLVMVNLAGEARTRLRHLREGVADGLVASITAAEKASSSSAPAGSDGGLEAALRASRETAAAEEQRRLERAMAAM